MLLKNCIEKLMRQQNLEADLCQSAVHEILKEDANLPQVVAFLVALRSKTETAAELAGMLSVFKQKMIPVQTHHRVLDIVGTGGDGANTINISTGSAILAASCGIKIAKHGNRAVSSATGSADVLEALGIAIDLSPEKISASIDEIGIGFCFAPNFHPALRNLRSLRKQLNIPTTLNLLGPLLNPTSPAHVLLGVFDESLSPIIAEALKSNNSEKSMVVHGCGLDEISCVGPAKIFEISKSGVTESIIDPGKLGLAYCKIVDLQGGNATENAQLLFQTFSTKFPKKNQAIAETLILNAAVALYLYGLYPSIPAALSHSRENLYNGSAETLLKNWIEFTHDQ